MRPPGRRSEGTIQAGLRPPAGGIAATGEKGGGEKIWSCGASAGVAGDAECRSPHRLQCWYDNIEVLQVGNGNYP